MKRLFTCLTLLMLAACAQSPTKEAAKEPVAKEPVKESMKERPEPAAVKPVQQPNELLAFARRYAELSAENQKKEYAQAMRALNRNKSDTANRMKVALILGLPSSRLRDNERALALLDEVQRDRKVDADSKALAGLLKEYLGDRQKLEDNVARANQKAADEQKRADDLQQKLDELKTIEKTLIERGQAGPK